jgi:hypothetical protein
MRLPTFVVVTCLALSGVVSAQLRYRPDERGPWRPWSFTAIASARTARGATAAEVQAFQTRLQELGAIVKRAPAVAEPIGFAAEMWGHLSGYPPPTTGQPAGTAVPLAGGLSFGAFPLIEFMRNGKLMNEDMKGGETEMLQFTVNQIGMGMYTTSRPGEWGREDVEAFFEPRAGQAYAGLPRIEDVYVVKRHDRPLWIHVPLADALAPVIVTRRALSEDRRDVYARHTAEFAEWQTPEKRAARRADWQRAAATMPDYPDFLKNMEESEREIEAANRARLAPGGPDEKGVREAERDLREAESALAGLTPDARAAASCYNEAGQGIAGKFRAVAGSSASCRALVKPNWAYFDSTVPRSAPQVLMLTSFTRCLTPQSMAGKTRGGCAINRALIDSLDWDGVRAWLAR